MLSLNKLLLQQLKSVFSAAEGNVFTKDIK